MAALGTIFVASKPEVAPPLRKRGKRVMCPYCGERAPLVGGQAIYPHMPSLWGRAFYLCEPCGAYVGTHRNSNGTPLGTLANAALREARKRAHAAFDPIWKSRRMSRSAAYAALAKRLDLDPRDCHIGMFDERQCAAVLIACREITSGKAA